MTTDRIPSAAPFVAVIGATGRQGGSVVDALLERGARVRALVRDPGAAGARSLADRGVELSAGDLDDAVSLDRLFAGVDAAFAMTTPRGGIEHETASGIAAADAAARARVPHFVFSSVGGAERHTGIPHFESKRRVEEHLDALGLHRTIIRPVFFMDNLAARSVSVEDRRVVVRMALPPHVPLEMVAVRDIGRVAAAILLGGTPVEGASLEIAGDRLTGDDIAEAVGLHAGLPARYEALPLEAVAPFGDMAQMFRWFAETPAYQADFATTREIDPELLDLDAWLAQSGWRPGSDGG
ncbi:NmrA/HSCARG family protein [Leifsonia sp. EB34]|uniref:NmrA/HSCARG family protein n=1 Tax=Leifsonia sp. EB34 TaxID=3156303 RepID=UPI0035113926